MSKRPEPPARKGTLALGEALDHSIELGQLMARLQASRQRFETIRNLLPPELQAAVRPGPLDDAGWSLLAEGSAAAAKLRQMLPRLQAQLLQAGLDQPPVRVKVQPRA
jgi:hypothetical protein